MRQKFGDDWARIAKQSIIEESPSGEKFVRMAYLAVIASSHINGVAAIHSGAHKRSLLAWQCAVRGCKYSRCTFPRATHAAEILRNDVFKPFYDVFPERFQNKTNGVTPRRWLAFCNPGLRDLITETLGNDAWINDLDRLQVRWKQGAARSA